MAENFKTIKALSEGIYKEKGSKFLSFALPVTTIDEIKILLDEYKKKYFDARHVCYAYVIGADKLVFRSSDDGEPSGTAGRPILGQIHSRDLTNVLVIVVRYFGGVLLGTGGLVTAYKEAAADALNEAEIFEKQVTLIYNIQFPYLQMNNIMKVIKDLDLKIHLQHFELECEIQLEVCMKDNDIFHKKMNDIDQIICKCLSSEYS